MRYKPFEQDTFFLLSALSAVIIVCILVGLFFHVFYEGMKAFQEFGLGFVTSTHWNISKNEFGALAALWGTLMSSVCALFLGAPMAIGIAIFLTEYSPHFLRRPVRILVELLASIPSIIYGMWGLFVFVPFFSRYVQVPVSQWVRDIPVLNVFFSLNIPSGMGLMTAGIILAIMIIPLITSVTVTILEESPRILRESAYGQGFTTWEVLRYVILPNNTIPIVGAILLGLGRAFGETMAVGFVIGNSSRFSFSFFDPATTIASKISLEFNEAEGLHMHSLLALGALLFVCSIVILSVTRILIKHRQRER